MAGEGRRGAQGGHRQGLGRRQEGDEVGGVATGAGRHARGAFAAEVKTTLGERLAAWAGAELDPARLAGRAGNRLELTDEQKEQLAAIVQAHRSDLAAVMAAEVAARTALNAAIHQPVVDDLAVRRASVAVAAVDLGLERAAGAVG